LRAGYATAAAAAGVEERKIANVTRHRSLPVLRGYIRRRDRVRRRRQGAVATAPDGRRRPLRHSGRPGALRRRAPLGTGLASLPASGSSKPSRSGGVRPYDPFNIAWIVLGSVHHDLGRGV
jgi:hypothetical protein